MKIMINDIAYEFQEGAVLYDAILSSIEAGQAFAVALNHVFVQKAYYRETLLKHEDVIHVVIPMQGG